MSGTYQNNLVDGMLLVLTHGLKCRFLTGTLVGLEQNSVVKVLLVHSLPGWCILQNEGGWLAPVRSEFVHQIAVPATGNGRQFFPPAPLADSTVQDVLEVDEPEFVVSEDVVVCDSHGQAQLLTAGSVVSIFAHNPSTLAWFHTEDGQTFVVDVRRPILMRPLPLPQVAAPTPQQNSALDRENEGTIQQSIEQPELQTPHAQGGKVTTPLAPINPRQEAPEDALPANETPAPLAPSSVDDAPAQQPSLPANDPASEAAKKGAQAEELTNELPGPGVGGMFEWDDFFPPAWPPSAQAPAFEPPAFDADYLRGVQATGADFLGTDADFCEHCFSFEIDHAAGCPIGGRRRGWRGTERVGSKGEDEREWYLER